MRHRLPHSLGLSGLYRIPGPRSGAPAPQAAASAALSALGQLPRTGTRLARRTSRSVEHMADRVITAVTHGSAANEPLPITVPLVTGGPDVVVPDVRGDSEGQAIERLEATGLVAGQLGEDRSDGPPVGSVMRTRPPVGSVVAAGTTVGYVIASSVSPASDGSSRHPGHIDPDAFIKLMQAWSRPSGVPRW